LRGADWPDRKWRTVSGDARGRGRADKARTVTSSVPLKGAGAPRCWQISFGRVAQNIGHLGDGLLSAGYAFRGIGQIQSRHVAPDVDSRGDQTAPIKQKP